MTDTPQGDVPDLTACPADSWGEGEHCRSLADLVIRQLEAQKAENIVTIDLAEKSSIADAMIIASGRSERHVGALANLVQRAVKNHGYGSITIEGMQLCDWVLLDIGDLIVHIFRPEIREIYNLERLWSADIYGHLRDPL